MKVSILKLLFAFLAVFLFLSGCSRLELTLKWADTFVLSEIGDYFDMNSMQKEEARREFKQALREAKKHEFGTLGVKLDEFSVQLQAGKMTPDEFEVFLVSLEPIIKKMFARFEPLAQKIVDDQAAKGFEKFDKTFNKKFEKDQEALADPKKLQKEFQKKIDFWLKETVESLTADQEKYLRDQLAQNPPPSKLQLDNRRQVFEQFKSVRGAPAQRKKFIHELLTDWESTQTPEYRKASADYRKKFLGWLKEIFKMLTPLQKERMVEHVKKRASEFQKLSMDDSI